MLLVGAGVWALRPAQSRLVKRNKQPILSSDSDRRCTCSLLLVHAYGHSYSTVPAATPSSDAPVFLLNLPQARPGTQRYNWELGRLGSLSLVGTQSRRRKNLITNPYCLVGVSGETKAMGVNANRKFGVEPLRRSYVNSWNLPAAPAAKLVPSVVLCIPLDTTNEAERRVLSLGQPRTSKHLTQACATESVTP